MKMTVATQERVFTFADYQYSTEAQHLRPIKTIANDIIVSLASIKINRCIIEINTLLSTVSRINQMCITPTSERVMTLREGKLVDEGGPMLKGQTPCYHSVHQLINNIKHFHPAAMKKIKPLIEELQAHIQEHANYRSWCLYNQVPMHQDWYRKPLVEA
jgi:hypothetical protein